jgi:hypothetical protein
MRLSSGSTQKARPDPSTSSRFKGVATDYLENYLGWFRALDRASKNRRKSAPMLALALGLGEHH